MDIRFAKEDELVSVNELRKQVNDLYVEGKPYGENEKAI